MRRVDRVAKEIRDGEALEAAAKLLAQTLHDPLTEPKDRATLARELRMTLAALAARPSKVKGDAVDEVAARRKARRGRTST